MTYKTSNSKLTISQKQDLKILKMDAELTGVTVVQVDEVTLAYKRGPTVTRFTVAVASCREQKIRGKVGKYHALNRFFEGEATILPNHIFSDLLDILQ